ncbi:enkurin [Anarhichas minor]|uniref:enkurin n=1 Tax=Anarhichas minor TaxID=65739 RepID=UPI003F733A6A
MSGVVNPPESVYSRLTKEEVHAQKPQRYMSKYRPTVVLEEKSTKRPMRTMGPAKVEVPSPENFLKKHSKEPKVPEKAQCSKEHTCTVKKADVPAQTDRPLMGIHTKRDFVQTATAVTMKPQLTSVDTRHGHRQLLETSGLVPKYIKKKHYGEVPEYLQQRKEDERRAQEEYEDFVKEQRERGAMKRLSDQERQATLEGLKKTWDELHREYQGLSFVTDNLRKKSHRDQLEVAMKNLENDMDLFKRFKTIYIPNN